MTTSQIDEALTTDVNKVTSTTIPGADLRTFIVAGLTVWNSLPDSLRDRAVESERVSVGLENALLCRNPVTLAFYGVGRG